MRTIIAGSRSIMDKDLVFRTVDSCGFADQITEVFCGGAGGVDAFGAAWAWAHKIPIRWFRPEWDKYGKVAAILRNCEMATYADAAVVIWDGESRGTSHILGYFKKLDPPVRVYLKTLTPTTLVTQGRAESTGDAGIALAAQPVTVASLGLERVRLSIPPLCTNPPSA